VGRVGMVMAPDGDGEGARWGEAGRVATNPTPPNSTL